MTNSRTIQISLDHLVAEMVSFPLTARASLEIPTHVLCSQLDGSSGRMWRKAEQQFVRMFPHLSLDELISIRNSIWFGGLEPAKPPSPVSLAKYLQFVSHEFLEKRGATAVPKLPCVSNQSESPDPAARRAWRWLTFAMPADLLLAGLAVDNSGPVRVNSLSPGVEIVLREGGYAETHLHLGAALDFTTVWASAVNVIGRSAPGNPNFSNDAFKSPGADFSEGKQLGPWLVRGAIVRYLLASFLQLPGKSKTLAEYLEAIGDRLEKRFLSASHRAAIRTAIRDLHSGSLNSNTKPIHVDEKASFAVLQNAYNALTQVSTIDLPERFDHVQRLDPLSDCFTAHGHPGPSVQLQFLWRGMEYMLQAPNDVLFAHLFWQVERVRGVVYRHCVQRPLTPGLMNFIRYYERKSAITGPLEKVELESAGRIGGMGHGLKSLEVRNSPASNIDKQSRNFSAWRKQHETLTSECMTQGTRNGQTHDGRFEANPWRDGEWGVVLHLLKMRGKPADDGLPRAFDCGNQADPQFPSNASGYRWQDFSIGLRRTAAAITGTIRRDPGILRILRGLDVCRDEHGVPSWVFASWFAMIRDEVQKISESYRLTHQTELPALRSTAHIGEDFVHLMSGIRYMDEAIDHIPLVCGDRVGHGLALGIEPLKWAEKAQRLAIPREDRFFDLVWERRWHAKQGSCFGSDRKTFVEDEIVRLSQEIFGREESLNPSEAMQFVDCLHTPRILKKLGFPNQMLNGNEKTGMERILERYLTEPSLYRRCRTVEWVNVAMEATAIAELQRLVRKRFANLGVTIEVNPISNLLVGDLSDLKTHPLWRLASGLENDQESTLRICVGSDDPFPFSTNLPEEYQFLFDALVLAGKSQAESRVWLDDIRRIGLESRFTLPHSSPGSAWGRNAPEAPAS